jgi:hypothetical protein
MLAWCLARRVHCISDEIYANSIFSNDGPEFRSLAHLVSELPEVRRRGWRGAWGTGAQPAPAGVCALTRAPLTLTRVPLPLPAPPLQGSEQAALARGLAHVVWGLSKDFCASGLRVGCLWSRNQQLLQVRGCCLAGRHAAGAAPACCQRLCPLSHPRPSLTAHPPLHPPARRAGLQQPRLLLLQQPPHAVDGGAAAAGPRFRARLPGREPRAPQALLQRADRRAVKGRHRVRARQLGHVPVGGPQVGGRRRRLGQRGGGSLEPQQGPRTSGSAAGSGSRAAAWAPAARALSPAAVPPLPRRRHLLDEPSFEGEARLWNKLVDEQRLILTPGSTCHSPQPGFFRMCYAWVAAEALPAAVARIVSLQADGKA